MFKEELPPSARELCSFTKQLATILRAGVPLLNALATLDRNTHSRSLGVAIRRARDAITNGATFSEGLARSPTVFSRLYVALVSSGESSGILEKTLETLCKNLERSHTLRTRMIKAMTYPTVVVATLILVVIFLLTWIIPTFEDIFNESGVPLPLLTRWVLLSSRFLTFYWSYALGLCGVLMMFVSMILTRSPNLVAQIEQLTVSFPILRNLAQKKRGSECASLLSALLGAGMPILDAIETVRGANQSLLVVRQLQTVREALLEGHSLTTSLKHVTIFPPLVHEMVAIGEASGRLEEMLLKAGNYLEEELASSITTFQDLVEPILLILIGLVVGTLVVALYLPIFEIGSVAGVP